MTRQVWLPCTIIAVALFIASTAAAAARVLVAARETSSMAERIEKELAAVGLETVRALTPCSPATIAELASAAHAVAATCTDDDVVIVWTVSGDFVRLEEVIHRRSADTRDALEVPVRVAEVTRASIQLAEDGIERADAPVRRPREWDATLADDLFVPEALLSPRGDEPASEPRASSSATRKIPIRGALGVARYLGSNVGSDSVDGMVAVGFGPRLNTWLRLAVPITATGTSMALLPPNRESNGGNYFVSKIAVGLAAVGVDMPFVSREELFSLRLGGGVGVYWFSIEHAQHGTRESIDTTIVASPAVVTSLEPSLRIFGPLRITGSATAGVATMPAKVRVTVDDAYVQPRVAGPAIFALAGRFEVLTR